MTVDDQGIIVDAIPADIRMVYVTPSHQSPTGATMSLPRRRALLELADRYEIALVEDDYDTEYRHADRPLEPLSGSIAAGECSTWAPSRKPCRQRCASDSSPCPTRSHPQP